MNEFPKISFLSEGQLMVILHGHVYESARLTGFWQEKIGRTYVLSAAHDGPELAIICFDPAQPEKVVRRLL